MLKVTQLVSVRHLMRWLHVATWLPGERANLSLGGGQWRWDGVFSSTFPAGDRVPRDLGQVMSLPSSVLQN